jgi:hypothetical protein
MNNGLNNSSTYKKQSLYKIALTKGEHRKNLGYDYTKTLMEKTVSKHTSRNPIIEGFLSYITDYFVNLIRAVKWVQIHRVYTVDKDYEYID